MPNREGETADDDLIKSLRSVVRAEETDGDSDADNDEDESSNEGEGDETTDDGKEPEPVDPTDAKLNAFVDELVESIEKGDTNNKVYKGLQKVIGRKDSVITAQEAKLADAERRMREAEDHAVEVSEGMQWLTETLLENLPEEQRNAAVTKLLAKQNEFLRNKRPAPAQAVPVPQGTQGMTPEQVEAQQKIAQYKQQFLDSRKAAVVRAGLKPDDPLIDYGDENDTLLNRIDTFEASLEKAKEAAEKARIDKVSKKPPSTATRSGGGGVPKLDSVSGPDRLTAGANARLEKLRKAGII